ncbi:MAG: Re/Si-specific NAD(P)(+) transhydrogenase subunit alpha [Mariprofundaceae bacterium]
MRIAVPAETIENEARVAATPETIKKFIAAGCDVTVQKGAGDASFCLDARYVGVGATIANTFTETCHDADLVLKVRAPSKGETASLAGNTAVAAMFSPYTNPLLKDYNQAGLICFAMEMVPRISRAQNMDVLSSQANISGYKAVLLALEHYKKFVPMLMTAAGTVQPAKVLILGAGVAGLQAIATAKRLGARVEVFDVRAAAREQVESLGATFIEVPVEEDAEDAGGYAKEMSDAYKAQQAELIAERSTAADIIITTALIPGRPAPLLITEETVKKMKPGSVIVDLATEMGGNCQLSELDAIYEAYGVTLVGISNIPALMASDASSLYARNLFNYVSLMLDSESNHLKINREDEIIKASLLCLNGEFLQPQLLKEGQ